MCRVLLLLPNIQATKPLNFATTPRFTDQKNYKNGQVQSRSFQLGLRTNLGLSQSVSVHLNKSLKAFY